MGEFGYFNADTIAETFQVDLPLFQKAYSLPTKFNRAVAASESIYESYNFPVGHSWPNDPYAKGSYSFIAAGQEEAMTALQDVSNETVKKLFAPIDNSTFFAGEHATILLDVGGTMEAAVESGERTARLILKVKWSKN